MLLPIRIETGRFNGLKPEERVCQLCNSGEMEDEKHFILTCDRYTNQRQILFIHLSNAFNLLDSNEKFKYLITHEYRHVAKYITQSFYIDVIFYINEKLYCENISKDYKQAHVLFYGQCSNEYYTIP